MTENNHTDAGAGSATEGALPPIDVTQVLDGQTILIIGITGFVGKVCLSMLLSRYPNIGKVYALVRPGMGNSSGSTVR